MKKILIIVGGILGIIVFYSLFLWISYIDDTVTSGDAYGFRIGDTKIETYSKAREIFKRDRVYILYPLERVGYGPHYRFHFSDEDYAKLSTRGGWAIYMDEGFLNSIRLKFNDDTLVEIHRHRKYFEVP